MAPPPVPALPRLQVWQPQRPLRFVVRSRQPDSLALLRFVVRSRRPDSLALLRFVVRSRRPDSLVLLRFVVRSRQPDSLALLRFVVRSRQPGTLRSWSAAAAGQRGTQGPVRTDEPGGRTPAQGGSSAPPVTPPAGPPQARMPAAPTAPATRTPGPPMQPAAPSAIPAPSQEKDTARNERVGAGLPVDSPEAHHLAKSKVGLARRTRKARLRLSRLDPWSVMKTSFLFSIAAGIMLVAAVYSLWTVLSTSQLFDSINQIVASVVSTPGDTTPFRIEEYINTQKVMGVTALVACVDVVIFTALATLGSFLYNLAATMLGGLEITLAED